MRRSFGCLAIALLVVQSWSNAQAPNLNPAQILPGSPAVGPAAGSQQAPAIALGAGQSLLVFEDSRRGDSDIFGVRLGAFGAPIDAIPFPITKAPGDQTTPKVVWNGQNWLVVYTTQVDPGNGYFAYEFAALRVSPQGQVLDVTPIVIGSDNAGGNYGVASDGNNWVVVYTGYSAGNNAIFAKRISPSGTILDPAGVQVSAATSYIIFGLSASFGQNEYVFTWLDGGLRARRFASTLQPIDSAPVLLPFPSGSMSPNGTHFLVAWPRTTPYFTTEIVASRLNANLATVDLNPIMISGSSPNDNHTDPRAVWDGTQWIISWLKSNQQVARATRLTPAGAVLNPGGVTIPEASPSVLSHATLGALPGGGGLVAWNDARYGSGDDVYGTPFFALGFPGAETCFSLGSEALQSPRVTPGPDQYLVTFKAELSNGSRVLAQRLDAVGEPIDGEPIEIAAAGHPSLLAGGAAWNGTTYLVTWSDPTQGQIFARRLLPDGTWLDAAPISVMLGSGADVAALGSDFLVTGVFAPSNPQDVFSYGARVHGTDGLVLDSPALSIGPSFATRARVVALGGSWLVATESHLSHDQNPASLNLNFVDPNGVVAPAFSAGTLNIQNWGSIDIASSGSSAVIVGETASNWTNADVRARRILPDGSMPAPILNVTASAGMGQSRPCVTWTGAEYLIAYETLQNNVWSYDFEPDVYAVRLSDAGAVLDPAGFALWNGGEYDVSVDGGALGGGRAVMAVSTYVDDVYGSPRIGIRGLRPVGITSFGGGTPGCSGPERMDASLRAFTGSAGFGLLCTRAPLNATGLVVASDTASVPGSDPFGAGILLHVGVMPPAMFLLFPMSADAGGLGMTPFPIPANPSLVGFTFYAQAAFVWSGSCVPSPLGISTSDCLAIQIQAP